MIVKGIVDEDLTDYGKSPSMLIAFSKCSFKCDVLNNCKVCQNGHLANLPDKKISNEEIIHRYISNNLTHAIVCAGLEPLDQFSELISFIKDFREVSDDPIIIYTGYTMEEVKLTGQYDILKQYSGIILKVGRYMMNCEPHKDLILGVKLASPNQYAERIS